MMNDELTNQGVEFYINRGKAHMWFKLNSTILGAQDYNSTLDSSLALFPAAFSHKKNFMWRSSQSTYLLYIY